MSKKTYRHYRVRCYQDTFTDESHFKKTIKFVVVSKMSIHTKKAVYKYGFIPSDKEEITDEDIAKIADSNSLFSVELKHLPPVKDKHRFIEHAILEDIGKNRYHTIPFSHRRFFEYIV